MEIVALPKAAPQIFMGSENAAAEVLTLAR
jgi:hypothetical protein